jgi:hypothetical protein
MQQPQILGVLLTQRYHPMKVLTILPFFQHPAVHKSTKMKLLSLVVTQNQTKRKNSPLFCKLMIKMMLTTQFVALIGSHCLLLKVSGIIQHWYLTTASMRFKTYPATTPIIALKMIAKYFSLRARNGESLIIDFFFLKRCF